MSRFFIEFPLLGLDYGPDHTIFEENGETWAQIGTREGSSAEYSLELGNNNGNDSQNGVANLRMYSGNRLFTVNRYAAPMRYTVNNPEWSGAAAGISTGNSRSDTLQFFKVVVETLTGPIKLNCVGGGGSNTTNTPTITRADFTAMGITQGVAYVCARLKYSDSGSGSRGLDLYINGQLRVKDRTGSTNGEPARIYFPRGLVVSSVCSALGAMLVGISSSTGSAPMPAWALSPNFSVKRVKAKQLLEYERDEDAPESAWKENDVTLEQIESGFKLYDKTRFSFETDYEDNPNMQPLGFCVHFTAGYTRRSPKYGTCVAGMLSGYANSPEDEDRFQNMAQPWANTSARHTFILQDFGVQTRRLGGGRISKIGTSNHSDMKYLQFQADINLDPG